MAGVFVSMQAQTLEYVVYNGSTSSVWDFKIVDSNSNEVEELAIQPGEERNGLFSNFAFTLYWKGVNNSNCDFNNQANGAVPETTVPIICGSPTSYTYKVVQVGANDWVFKIILN